MRKRERENPCGICGHYHKYEEGEVCGVCGHRRPTLTNDSVTQSSVFPSEIVKDFLYLGSYDNATRNEILKSQGITRILNVFGLTFGTSTPELKRYARRILGLCSLASSCDRNWSAFENTVPACQTLYRNSFLYFSLSDAKHLQFNEAIKFLDKCALDSVRVLVHCMFGKNRSAAVVIAYLMKSRGWRLAESYKWTKERRSCINISAGVYEELLMFEESLFGSPKSTPQPIFVNEAGTGSICEKINTTLPPSGFVFGATANGNKDEQPASSGMMMIDDDNNNNN